MGRRDSAHHAVWLVVFLAVLVADLIRFADGHTPTYQKAVLVILIPVCLMGAVGSALELAKGADLDE